MGNALLFTVCDKGAVEYKVVTTSSLFLQHPSFSFSLLLYKSYWQLYI